jgi:hypothetical protein
MPLPEVTPLPEPPNVYAGRKKTSTGLIVGGVVFGGFVLIALAVVIALAVQSDRQAGSPSAADNRATGPGAPAAAPKSPPLRTTPEELFGAYQQDRPAADARYRGKTIILTGVIGRVEENFGRPYVGALKDRLVRQYGGGFTSLEGGRQSLQQAALNATYLPRVYLYVRPGALELVQGQGPFTVRGVCRGAFDDRTTIPEMYVLVDDCTVAPSD